MVGQREVEETKKQIYNCVDEVLSGTGLVIVAKPGGFSERYHGKGDFMFVSLDAPGKDDAWWNGIVASLTTRLNALRR